jgi:hypothetical protein
MMRVRLAAMSPNRPLVAKRSLTGVSDNHPDNGDPPRTGAQRSWLDRGQPIADEPVQQCVREAMSQHGCYGAAIWCIGK